MLGTAEFVDYIQIPKFATTSRYLCPRVSERLSAISGKFPRLQAQEFSVKSSQSGTLSQEILVRNSPPEVRILKSRELLKFAILHLARQSANVTYYFSGNIR